MAEGGESTEKGTEVSYQLRDIDGTVLGVSRETPTSEYEIDPRTGLRKQAVKTSFTPLTVTSKFLPGEKLETPIGSFEVAEPLSKEYPKRWPDSVFVKRVVDQPKG
jgi:hypothetical protein